MVVMKFTPYLLIIFFLSSCSLFQTKQLSKDISVAAENICFNSEGKGRLTVKNKKYIFSYESFLEEEQAKWKLVLDFPLRPEESFELDWSQNNKMKFKSTIDTKILRENKNINPKELDYFVSSIGHFFKDIILLRNGNKADLKNKWHLKKNSLFASSKSKRAKMKFSNLTSENYFGLMNVSYIGKEKQTYKLDFIVRKCFKNEASDS